MNHSSVIGTPPLVVAASNRVVELNLREALLSPAIQHVYNAAGLQGMEEIQGRPEVCEERAEMRRMHWLVVGTIVMAIAVNAGAQTKFSGSCNQGKPDPNYTATVGDRPGHALVLAKVKCTWTKGDLDGAALKEEDDTFTSDVTGKTSRDKGYGVGTTASGDKYFVSFQGTTTYEKGAPVSATCTWRFSGGTGKLKGLTGKGTCTGKFDPTGAAVFDMEGEYQVAAAKAK